MVYSSFILLAIFASLIIIYVVYLSVEFVGTNGMDGDSDVLTEVLCAAVD